MAESTSMPDGARGGGKRKGKWYNASLQHGSIKHNKKKKELGRGEWSRQPYDRRAANDERNAKRQKREEEGGDNGPASVLPAPFSKEEVAAEERKPKCKVAVLIGYSGSGYKGMQINTTERTIEGDLFTAFVAAGAISKANANDPKKSSLVRCARTDKGVHAAGNVISLKLIIEDKDVVEKINAALSPQIRVWGIQRTVGSFNCYQACDSRWYEYLIPTHSFLPPHPDSHLAKKLKELAEEANDLEGYEARQALVKDFWAKTDEEYIKPVLEQFDESVRREVWEDIHSGRESSREPELDLEGGGGAVEEQNGGETSEDKGEKVPLEDSTPGASAKIKQSERRRNLEAAFKQVRQAYLAAKRAYRLPPERVDGVEEALQQFIGTKKYHNYTVFKSFHDASCKRVIKSFTTRHSGPVIINGTEWLSLKIHGQSFMMHQIRKMVAMVALVLRCGCPTTRIGESFQDVHFIIPKAPGLGLLLERPVFQSYNEGAADKFEREPIDFAKHERPMAEFKQREIYERIFREEEQTTAFHTFFTQVDAATPGHFLWLSSMGADAVKQSARRRGASVKGHADSSGLVHVTGAIDSDDDEEAGRRGEGDG